MLELFMLYLQYLVLHCECFTKESNVRLDRTKQYNINCRHLTK